MDIVEKLVRQFGNTIRHDGEGAIVTNGIPALVEAFEALGWGDPHVPPPDVPDVVAAPTVTSVAPPKGPRVGGTPISVAGADFVAGATVLVGGVLTTGVTVVDSAAITATTDACGTAGMVDVTVRNPDGQSGVLMNAFIYKGPPTVLAIVPAVGSSVSGTAITVTGTEFEDGATVSIGPVTATDVVVVDPGSITATAGAGTPGVVTVTVTNPDGQSGSLDGGFSYV